MGQTNDVDHTKYFRGNLSQTLRRVRRRFMIQGIDMESECKTTPRSLQPALLPLLSPALENPGHDRHEDPRRSVNASTRKRAKPLATHTLPSITRAPKTPTNATSGASKPAPTSSRQPRPTSNNKQTAPRTQPPIIAKPPPLPFQSKLNAQQIADLLKTFWNDLLQNHTKQIHKLLSTNHLKTLDFTSPIVRYAPNADATPLHICAQYGFLPMAKMLVGEFQFSALTRNKVGSTPLHVAGKFGQTAMVSWLIDELHVPLDVPDAHQHTALDVAPFEIIDKCILAPLRTMHEQLKERENQLVEEHNTAQKRLWDAELLYRRNVMTLNDTESHVEEEQVQIEAVGDGVREWHARYLQRLEELDVVVAEWDQYREILGQEEAVAHELFERDVRQVQDRLARAQQERDELSTLVETTQTELDRRNQLLVDQLGVFDASLADFAASSEVQTMVMTTLLAIARDEDDVDDVDSVDATGPVSKEALVLRPESVDVVRHVLSTFHSDYSLQSIALELLLEIQRVNVESQRLESERIAFLRAVVDSDLLLALGQTLVRWSSEPSKTLFAKVLEAMYRCLRLGRNAPRLLVLCQLKPMQLLPLTTLEAESRWATVADWQHASLVLVTQIQYGVKKALLKHGAIATLFDLIDRTTQMDDDRRYSVVIETLQYTFTALTMLVAQPQRVDASKSRSPALLEDLTGDPSALQATIILDTLHRIVFQCPDNCFSASCGAWGFKLLLSFVQHGGPTARTIHQQIEGTAFTIVCDGMTAIQNACTDADTRHSMIQAGFDLIQAVWIERFDQEGRVLPVASDILVSIASLVVQETEILTNGPCNEHDQRLVHLAGTVRVLVRGASTPKNAHRLNEWAASINDRILRVILQWIIRYVDETGASYREPRLIELLMAVLKLFYELTHAQSMGTKHNETDTLMLQRQRHNQSRETGVCAVLTLFRTLDHDREASCPREWAALRSLCSQVASLVRCTC